MVHLVASGLLGFVDSPARDHFTSAVFGKFNRPLRFMGPVIAKTSEQYPGGNICFAQTPYSPIHGMDTAPPRSVTAVPNTSVVPGFAGSAHPAGFGAVGPPNVQDLAVSSQEDGDDPRSHSPEPARLPSGWYRCRQRVDRGAQGIHAVIVTLAADAADAGWAGADVAGPEGELHLRPHLEQNAPSRESQTFFIAARINSMAWSISNNLPIPLTLSTSTDSRPGKISQFDLPTGHSIITIPFRNIMRKMPAAASSGSECPSSSDRQERCRSR